MKVELKAVTKPVDENLTVEDFIAYVARVSNPENQSNKVTSQKLLKYLRNNQHWSPFEMVHVVIEIETTRDIARQILRHRSFSFQEFSQRYADPTKMEFQAKDARLQDTKNRQNSVELDSESDVAVLWRHYQESHIENSKKLYQWAIDAGIAKEQARAVLPEGNTTSRLYMSGSLRSWIHYCQLRMANGTQKEHKEIAKACWEIILKLFPSLDEVEV